MCDVTQDLNQLRVDKAQLQTEFSDAQQRWTDERQRLVDDKDDERRRAVKAAEERAEADYKTFLAEHQDTLNKALQTARDSHHKERVCTSAFSTRSSTIWTKLYMYMSMLMTIFLCLSSIVGDSLIKPLAT